MSQTGSLLSEAPAARSYDPINPNPLISAQDLWEEKLISRATTEELRLLACQIIQSGVKMLKMYSLSFK
jgi:hypothetical protein